MARIFSDGYELGSVTDNVERSTDSGTMSLVTSTVRSGTYAGRANPTAATGFWRKNLFATDQTTIGFFRIYVNIASLPSSGTTDLCRFQTAANSTVATLKLTSTGTLQLFKANGTQIGSDSSALSTGAWTRIEFKNDATTNPGALEAKISGTAFASGANSAQGSWAKVTWGCITSTTADIYFDDTAVNDNSGTAQNDYPGSGKIVHLKPNAAGDNAQWTKFGTASTQQDSLNELPPDDGTTGIKSKVAAQLSEFNIETPGLTSSDTVNMVAVGVRFNGNVATPWSGFKVRVKASSGGTVSESSEITPTTTSWNTFATADPRVYPLTLYTLPSSSNPWTNLDIDSAQIGVNLSTAATNEAQITSLWLQVDYTPGAAVANKFFDFFE